MAGVAWQLVREFFSNAPPESDAALKMRIELLAEIVQAVGPDRFNEAVKGALRLARSRYDVTVSRIREQAGLHHVNQLTPAAKAWIFVTMVVARHVRRDPEGGYRLEPFVYIDKQGNTVREFAPEIPEPVARAVRTMGGWGALAQTDAQYWGQRMREFRDLYEE